MEENISDTLDSILNQSFQNFEVIIINDGSTDSTQKIIDKYSNKYSNINVIIQENQGVAIARNNALDVAKGEYIGFLDPDGDLFAEDSFYHINETINFHESNGETPDLIIGPQTTVDTWSKRSYKNAKELSLSDDILPHDERIIWTMLILNKMFRREKILETGVKMPILTHASDAGFFFSFLYNCKKIVGCPHDFLIYKKRLFLEDSSLSQDSNLNSVNSYYKSYKIILNSFNTYCINYKNELKKYGQNDRLYEFERNALKYIDTLIYKELTALFINITYRFFWRSDIKTLKRCKEIINQLRDDLFPGTWTKVVENNSDLKMSDLIIKNDEMAKNPIISIVLTDLRINNGDKIALDLDSLNRTILNCYNSHFPSFELIISEELFNSLNNEIINKPNIQVVKSKSNEEFKNNAVNKSKGKFLFFIEEDILFSPILFKKMFDKLNMENYDWVLFPMDPVIDKKFSKNDQYTINEFSKRETINSNLKHDFLLSDKLFKKDFLKGIDFKFSNNIKDDIQLLYDKGNYKKFNAHYILTTNEHLNNSFISIIIDNIKIEKSELEDLLKSIYNQTFKSFDIYLNKNLKDKVSNEYISMNNFNILGNDNFRKTIIKESKSKYLLFVDIPVTYDNSFLEKTFSKLESLNDKQEFGEFSFLSTPIFNSDSKSLYNFSTQELAYFYKKTPYPSNKSKFLVFDLYLSNKLVNIDYLRKNKIFFNNYYKDVLKLYRESKSIRIYQKLISTNLSQKVMFKSSFKNGKIPFSYSLFYSTHRMFLILLYIKEILNGEK